MLCTVCVACAQEKGAGWLSSGDNAIDEYGSGNEVDDPYQPPDEGSAGELHFIVEMCRNGF